MPFDRLGANGWWCMALPPLLLLTACSGFYERSPREAYERGVEAYREGRVREARIAVMNALQADPEDREARLLQARIFLDLGDGVAAEAEIVRAHQSGVAAAETRHLLAHARLLQNDARGALDLAGQAPQAHRGYAERVAALAQLALGDQLAAVHAFDRALAIDPNDSAVLVDIARFRRSIGDLGPAMAATDRAVAANPRSAAALALRGELTRSQYGLAAAIPWFDRALEIDPAHLPALLERASTFGDMGRMRAMLADSRAAQALAPEHPLPHFLQATLAARARMFDLSRALLRKTRGAYEDVPAGMLLAAALAYEANDHDGAERRLEALVARQPANLKARRLLAATRWRMGDAQGTLDALRPFADRTDADSYTLSLAAHALDRLGQGGDAIRYRERAARPDQSVRAALAWSNNSHPEVRAVAELLARGAHDEALTRARALQAAMPGAADVYLLVGDVLSARGDHRAAADLYRAGGNIAFTEGAAMRMIGALDRSGRAEMADGVLRLFASQRPRNVSAQLMLASRALAAGRWAEAIGRYEALRARMGNGDAALLNNLAWAYLQSGDDESALVYSRRAWALAPGNPATARTLGLTLQARGETIEALALLHAAARGRAAEALVRPERMVGR